ncbi:DUF2065 domain-containing protein [Sulfurivirga sp.]|uniref:DUF2065 domain-containing protein n=1 Tax=Sulfurivirga sp. TaxID=2614236 RepID=UPI0025FED666|nr:DUF2065 domain-containing protein [Sulfurivirga sp.]
MSDFQEAVLWSALGLAFILESVLPLALPAFWRRTMRQMTELPDDQIRLYGLSGLIIGLIIIYLVA